MNFREWKRLSDEQYIEEIIVSEYRPELRELAEEAASIPEKWTEEHRREFSEGLQKGWEAQLRAQIRRIRGCGNA